MTVKRPNTCIDCGKAIYGLLRCQPCDSKYRHSKKPRAGKCIDCGKQLVNPTATRCQNCGTKSRWLLHRDEMLAAQNTELFRTSASERLKKKWEDPQFRQAVVSRAKLQMCDLWLTQREAMLAGAKPARDACAEKLQDPEYRKYKSDVSKATIAKQWADPEFKRAESERLKKMWEDPDYRVKMAAVSKKLWDNPANRKRMSDKGKKEMDDPIHKQYMTNCVRKEWADPNSKLHKHLGHLLPSSLENKFKVLLVEADIVFTQQYNPIGYTKVYDFFLPAYNTLIEIDGTFWHKSEWAIKHGRPACDVAKDNWALDHGYTIVRIPEVDLKSNIVTEWLIPEVLQELENTVAMEEKDE